MDPPAAGSRRLATRFVSLAILGIGVAILAAAAYLVGSGGGGIVAGLVVGAIGLVALLAAFFFLLVPHRVDNLAEMQREYVAEHGEYEEK